MRALLAAVLLAAAFPGPAGAMDNISIVSDTVFYFEKVFGVRGRVGNWLVSESGSTLSYAFPGKGKIVFRLSAAASGARHVDLVQVEPEKDALAAQQAEGYPAFLAAALTRSSGVSCAPVRNDRDGINAFVVYSCAQTAAPSAPPIDLTVTVQNVGGRRLVFAQFAQKTR